MLKRGELKTLKDIIINKCNEYKDNIAFLEKNKDTKRFEEKYYSDLRRDTVALATVLANELNLKDEKIAVIGENSYKWFVSYMAITTAVGVVVPLDKELPNNEIKNLLERSNAKCIIYSSKKKNVIGEIRRELDTQMVFIEMDGDKKDEDKTYSYDKLLKRGNTLVDSGDEWYFKNEVNENEMRILMFTSGTTAKSKGVMLCHRNVISNLDGAIDLMRVTSEDRFFSVLPMHHIYESIVTCMYAVSNGSSIAICEGLKYISKDIKDTSPTVIVCVPLLVEHICKRIDKTMKELGKEKVAKKMIRITNTFDKIGIHLKRMIFSQIHDSLGGKLKYILVSAAPIEKSIINKIEGYGFNVFQGYGLTETASVVSGTRLHDKNRCGTVGTASNCEVKIDTENGMTEGEILVKGNNVMLGYYEDKDATDRVIKDGWFHTGDLAHFDKNGNIVITGRCKNVIVTNNGKNIFPEELENEINKIAMVKESMVFGEGDSNNISVCAIVTLSEEDIKEFYGDIRPDNKTIKEKIWESIKRINDKMVPYKAIKKLKIRIKDFEKTTTLKIKRFVKSNMDEI